MKHKFSVRARLASVVALVGLITASPCGAQDPLTIKTASGTVIGLSNNDTEGWLGIPYAAPPIGKLRWQPPQSAEPWATPRKAGTLPSSCAQNAELGPFARAGGSEDCLYLNVYRNVDAGSSAQKLPVFVWIHGGALFTGQGPDYNPSKLADQGKAVVVTLNYRLGVFGYFAHPDLDREGHQFANYGLMDQQAALRWVRENIAAFGGDPTNVTIAGESSGANSVMAHLASPSSAGLFQYAISMSGGGIMTRHPAFGSPRPLEVAQDVGVAFAKAVGCDSGGAACLRDLSTKRILDAQSPYLLNEMIIDGSLLPMHPSDAYRTGQFNKVPLVNGSTRDEGRFFVALPELMSGKSLTEADYPAWIEQMYGSALSEKVLREYPLDNFDSASEAYASATTDSMFACPGLSMNRAFVGKIPVYAYEFSDRTAPSYVDSTTFPLLAAHTYELSYIFPGFRGGSDVHVKLNPLQEGLSDEMVGYFSNVAQLNSREKEWPKFDPEKLNFMTFNLPSSRMVSGRFANAHHCAFWDKTGIY